MDEEEALRAEIARLSGAIQSHRQQPQSYHQPAYTSSYRARGRGAPFRGRGAPLPARNRTLILNDSTKKQPSSSSTTTDAIATKENSGSEGWVKRRTTHNMSLVSSSTFEKTEPARLAAIAATRTAKAEARAKAEAAAGSRAISKAKAKAADASVRRGDNMGEVVIDGVVFEFDPSGTKLVKKAIQPPKQTKQDDQEDVGATPLRTSVNGQSYVRTKRGNLVSAELVAKRKQQAKLQRLASIGKTIGEVQGARYSSKKGKGNMTLDNTKPRGLCSFFNKTGQCKRGLSCPFIHDVSKVSLCPGVLRAKGCTRPPGTCPLSHTPTPERVPHCVHYLRSGSCRNGGQCVYTHADLADGLDTKICRDFSRLGWCEKAKACSERHTWECPDFAEKGKCDKKGCRLLHVIRANTEKDTAPEEEPETMQDGDLFMRDDVAAQETEGEEDDEGRKRKWEEDEEGYSFVRDKKRRQGKAFVGQNDFISFSDQEDDEEDHESVHSEDMVSTEDEEAADASTSEGDDDDADDDERVERDL